MSILDKVLADSLDQRGKWKVGMVIGYNLSKGDLIGKIISSAEGLNERGMEINEGYWKLECISGRLYRPGETYHLNERMKNTYVVKDADVSA